ncbi:MAG: archaeosortase/exosortase family protein, partial [Pyrinomonadaceae bacterium]
TDFLSFRVSLTTFAVFRVKDFSFWRAAIIVSSAVPIAIFTNALRVSGTGILARYYGTQVADGFFHTFSGWVIYVVASLLLFGVGWLLDRVNPGKPTSRKSARQIPTMPTPQLARAEGAE